MAGDLEGARSNLTVRVIGTCQNARHRRFVRTASESMIQRPTHSRAELRVAHVPRRSLGRDFTCLHPSRIARVTEAARGTSLGARMRRSTWRSSCSPVVSSPLTRQRSRRACLPHALLPHPLRRVALWLADRLRVPSAARHRSHHNGPPPTRLRRVPSPYPCSGLRPCARKGEDDFAATTASRARRRQRG